MTQRRGPVLALTTALLVALVVGFIPVLAFIGQPYALERATGEASLPQQVKALVNLLRQRPVDTADNQPTDFAGVPGIGANTFFEQEVEEWKVRRSMEMLRDAGVHWIRQEFPWDRIEPAAKGNYTDQFGATWATYDRIVALAGEYGLEVVPRLTLPPNWSRRDNSVPRAPPDRYEDYGDYVAAVVARYRGKVRYYQLWNEPNTVLEWGTPPNAADFTRLLSIGYQRAKQADPAATIIGAALSPTIGTPDGSNVSDLTYLQEMYDAGAARWFDIMSAQGYGLWTGPGDRRADAYRTNFSRVELIREVMVRNGDGHKPLWLAEVGWSALPVDFPGAAIHGRVTLDQQARYTGDALRRIRSEWPWVGVTFLWHFRRVSDEQRAHEDYYFRMVEPDFTPMPVYKAVQEATGELPVLASGWRSVADPAVARTGLWQAGVRTIDDARVTTLSAQSPAAALQFTFVGRDLTVQVGAGGSLQVTVDGARSTVSGKREGEAVNEHVVAAGLPWGAHQVELRAVGDGPVEVVGVLIGGRDLNPVHAALGAALFAAAALAAAAGYREAVRR